MEMNATFVLCVFFPDEGSCEQDPVDRYTVGLYTFKSQRERQSRSRSVTIYIALLLFLRLYRED